MTNRSQFDNIRFVEGYGRDSQCDQEEKYVWCPRISQGPSAEQIEILLKQLEVGIPADAIELLSIPLPLNRGHCLALHNLGVKDIRDLRNLSDATLENVLGEPLTKQLNKLNC